MASKVSAVSRTLSTVDATTVIKDCITGISGGGGSVPSATEDSGASRAHDNMQPYLAINYIISLQGFFPPRN
jgi:microcystin-dependent protein